MTNNIPVYESEGSVGRGQVIGRVSYNSNLDVWDGHNYCSGVGRHLGLTRLRKSGQYVLIHGTQWEGEHDYAYVISKEEAASLVASRSPELFGRYKELEELTPILETD